MTTRVVLVDDHRVVTRGLQVFLESFDDIRVVGVGRSGEELIARLAEWRPDVIVLDLLMPGGLDGIATTRRIMQLSPGVRVVALTASMDDARMEGVLRAGAAGFVRKDADPEQLLTAIRSAVTGRPFLRSASGRISSVSDLSPREVDVLNELAAGRSNREIAERLHVSPETVKTHVASLLAKLQLPNRTALVAHAVRTGIVDA